MTLGSELDLDAVLQRIVELAVQITGARYGALGVLNEDGETIERFVTEGVSDEVRAAIGHPPVGHGILGLLIRERRPMRLPDLGADPRSYGFPPNHPPMHSFLGAPVLALGQVFGNLYLTEKQGAEVFSDDDEAALVVLATQAGVAVENARLYAETQRREPGAAASRGARGARAHREGAPRRGDPVPLRGRDGPARHGRHGAGRGSRVPDRRRRRGDRPGDPRSAQLHLRAAARHPRRSPARPGAEGTRQRVPDQVRRPHDRGGRPRGGRRAGLPRGRHRAAHARGPVQRGTARERHVVPDQPAPHLGKAPSWRSTTTASASTWRLRARAWGSRTSRIGSRAWAAC